MDISGARVPVAGATGVLGAALAADLSGRGARPALAGRDPGRFARAAQAHAGVPTVLFDAYDPAGSVIAAFTGVVADRPQPEMADYNDFKAALSAWLAAVRRETRTLGIRVLEVRPGHLETGFADRAVAGTAPPMPAGGDPRHVVVAGADAMVADTELLRTAPDGALVTERRTG